MTYFSDVLSFQTICSEMFEGYSTESQDGWMSQFQTFSLSRLLYPSVAFTTAHWADVRHPCTEAKEERERERKKKPSHSVDSWVHAKDPEFHMPHIRFQLSSNPTLNQKAFFPLKRAFLLTATGWSSHNVFPTFCDLNFYVFIFLYFAQQ